MIFVDTSAWYAIEVEDDINHERSRKFLAGIALGKYGIAITTDYVLDETLTLLRSRRDLTVATVFIEKIRRSKSIRVFWIDEGLFEKAEVIFRKSGRMSWSFTDSTSFALMRELSISDAFAYDKHFKEAGFNSMQ